jgi:hypothetical protein
MYYEYIKITKKNWLEIDVKYGVEGVCEDPGETGAILEAGWAVGPSPPRGGKDGQLASDSGGG